MGWADDSNLWIRLGTFSRLAASLHAVHTAASREPSLVAGRPSLKWEKKKKAWEERRVTDSNKSSTLARYQDM